MHQISGCACPGWSHRILDCSVEGPCGAKLGEAGEVDAVGEDGRDAPLPSPEVCVSFRRLVTTHSSMCAYPPGTRPAANRRVSRSPCQRYLIVRGRASVGPATWWVVAAPLGVRVRN
jgi:hypothetical protein